MKTYQILTASLCVGLAACGGISPRSARWYDPQSVRQSGPVDMTVIGAPSSEQSAIVSAVADSLRSNGAQAGQAKPVGDFAPGYRLNVLYGPVAYDVTQSGQSDGYTNACRTINSQPGASLSGPGGATAGSGTPVLALLCYRNEYEALAYVNLNGGTPVGIALAQMVDQLFPADSGAND